MELEHKSSQSLLSLMKLYPVILITVRTDHMIWNVYNVMDNSSLLKPRRQTGRWQNQGNLVWENNTSLWVPSLCCHWDSAFVLPLAPGQQQESDAGDRKGRKETGWAAGTAQDHRMHSSPPTPLCLPTSAVPSQAQHHRHTLLLSLDCYHANSLFSSPAPSKPIIKSALVKRKHPLNTLLMKTSLALVVSLELEWSKYILTSQDRVDSRRRRVARSYQAPPKSSLLWKCD